MRLSTLVGIAIAFGTPLFSSHAVFGQMSGARIEDIATVQGVRGNQLIGYGLVVGLAGTGDSTQVAFTTQSVASMLQKFGINIPATTVKMKNVAAVMVTADLPAFAKDGSDVDVTVSSLGDSTSLLGGELLQTPLQAANGSVYAVAQGSVSVGGFSAGSGSGGGVSQNHVTAGKIPGGAIVEQNVPTTLTHDDSIAITLDDADFTTATRVMNAINSHLPAGAISARASDASTINVQTIPGADPIPLIAQIENLSVSPDVPAKVVIDERTGTVVLGGDVTVSACAIAHGNLTVQIADDTQVSQPNPLSQGTTKVIPRTNVAVTEGSEHLINVPDSPTISKVVKALNALGVTPRDLISILQAMKEAGALHADVVIQ
jgi:flagellar P-ring protein precursor FlgI